MISVHTEEPAEIGEKKSYGKNDFKLFKLN
jgi:hypothetical protein